MPDRESVVRSRIATIRHVTSQFGDFGGPVPSQDGPPEKKFQLESGLNQRDEATQNVSRTQVPAFESHKTSTRGVRDWSAPWHLIHI